MNFHHFTCRNYLRKNRYVSYEQIVDKVNSVQAVTPKDILTFAWQIAKGMNYLTDMKVSLTSLDYFIWL